MLVPDALVADCRGVRGAGCREYGSTPHFLYTRNELRLQASLGMAYRFASKLSRDRRQIVSKPNGSRVTFGLVPFAILWAEPSDYECAGCSIPRGSFDSRWGLNLMMAYDYYPEHEASKERFVEAVGGE